MNGLVIEGGARRCIFAAGVLDSFDKEGIRFDYIAGVSAGAQLAMNYASGQCERSKKMIMPGGDGESGLLQALLSADLKKLAYEYPYGKIPFDFEKYFSSPVKCEMVVTNCKTGKPEYLSERVNEKRLLDCLCASCSLPLIFPMVSIDGNEYLDGSVSDAVPFERAFSLDCDRVVCVLAKPTSEQATDYSKFSRLIKLRYGKEYPKLADVLLNRLNSYMGQMKLLDKRVAEGRALVIRPDKKYVRSFETSAERLEAGYAAGVRAAAEVMDKVALFMR